MWGRFLDRLFRRRSDRTVRVDTPPPSHDPSWRELISRGRELLAEAEATLRKEDPTDEERIGAVRKIEEAGIIADRLKTSIIDINSHFPSHFREGEWFYCPAR